MKTYTLVMVSMFGLLATGGGASPSYPAAPSQAVQKEEPPVVCGFRNSSYTGLCEERTPYVKDKELKALCQPILDCLNNAQCIKTYCGNSTIRRGWTLESAKRAK